MTRRLAAGIVLMTLGGGAGACADVRFRCGAACDARRWDARRSARDGARTGDRHIDAGDRPPGGLGSFTTWPEPIGRTVAPGGRFDLARDGWKPRPAVLLGTWRKPTRGASWQLIFGGGVGFPIRGRWSGSVALGVITIRSTGLLYAVPQTGVAYTLLTVGLTSPRHTSGSPDTRPTSRWSNRAASPTTT